MSRLDVPELWWREALLGHPETPAPDVGHVLNTECLSRTPGITPGPETITITFWCVHLQNENNLFKRVADNEAPRTDLSLALAPSCCSSASKKHPEPQLSRLYIMLFQLVSSWQPGFPCYLMCLRIARV